MLRAKGDGVNNFFVTPNPENPIIEGTFPQLRGVKQEETFNDTINKNSDSYGDIARIQGVYNNVIVPYFDLKDFEKIVTTFCQKLTDEFILKVQFEIFFMALGKETEEVEKDCFKMKNRKPALYALGEYLKSKSIDLSPIVEFLISMKNRQSMCLAFNHKLIKSYKVKPDAVDISGELVIDVPDGKLSLNTIHGFESNGKFEDEVLRKLGI